MEYIDRIFYRKINPSDFKKLYDIDKPASGGGQTYLEAAGISNDSLTEFLRYAEISDSKLDGEHRSIFTFNAHVLGNSSESAFIEFAPRKNRANYRISRQNMKYKHPAWSTANGFPEPSTNENGEYISSDKFPGIIDNLVITIIRTTYKKYYAGFINSVSIPENWPKGIDLERIFEGERRGVLCFHKCIEFRDSLNNPFGTISDIPVEKFRNSEYIEPPYEINKNPENKDICFNTNIKCRLPRNRIIFGAPGTGKSFLINDELTDLLNEFNVGDDNYERVTFHPDYSYANFVGTYKPVMDYSSVQTLDEKTKTNLEFLKNSNKSAQEKYDFFYDNEQDIGLTRIPILIGIATDEPFHTKKSAGDDAANDNIVERNHGIALRKYVQLKGENSDVKSSEISYKYVPGPFMRMYVEALRNAQKVAKGDEEPRPFLLIIEEINRANVAAVFGDVFQLLDRKNNVSEYPIQASEDIKQYLAEQLGGNLKDYAKIRIPDNMFIWATMNSADQGVFPMDTAFKRRWDFTYLGIDDNDEELKDKFVSMIHHGEQKFVEWNSLRMAINEFLANEKINEDKQLGPYFIAKDIVVPATGNEINKDKFNNVFKHKVLMYLFDDAAKQKRSKLFEGIPTESSRYSKICKAFEEKGVDIFHSSIRDMVITRGYLHEAKEPEHLNETEDWKESDA